MAYYESVFYAGILNKANQQEDNQISQYPTLHFQPPFAIFGQEKGFLTSRNTLSPRNWPEALL